MNTIKSMADDDLQEEPVINVQRGLKVVSFPNSYPTESMSNLGLGMRQVVKVLTFNHLIKAAIHAGDDDLIVHYASRVKNIVVQHSLKEKTPIKKYNIPVSINQLLYARDLKLYVAFCNDLHLSVFNKDFELLETIPVSSTILSLCYNENTHEVYTGGMGSLLSWKLKHKLGGSLVPSQTLQCHLKDNEWIVYLNLNQQSSLLCVACQRGVFLVNTETREQQYYIPNPHSALITNAVIYAPCQYVITSAKDGSIKISSYILLTELHSLQGHTKELTSLILHPKYPYCISSSLDGTIRLWHLQTLTQCHRYDINVPIIKTMLTPTGDFVCFSHQKVVLLSLHQVECLLTVLNSQVILIKTDNLKGKERALVLTEDGGVRLLSPITGHCLTIIFPMMSTPLMKDARYDSLENLIYILLYSGEISVFVTTTNPCTPKELWKPANIQQEVTCIDMVQSDIGPLLLAGHRSGALSVLHSKDCLIGPPCPAHDGPIMDLVSTQSSRPLGENPVITVVSYGNDHLIQVWAIEIKVDSRRQVLVHTILSISPPLQPICMSLLDNKLCMATIDHRVLIYSLPYMEIPPLRFYLNNVICPTTMTHTLEDAHRDTITFLAACSKLKLFVSCSKDGWIKVWDLNCQLVSNINLGSQISAVCFTQTHDLLIGFQNHLYTIPAHNYLPSTYYNAINTIKETNTEQPLPFESELQFLYDSSSYKLPTLPLLPNARLQEINALSLTNDSVHTAPDNIRTNTLLLLTAEGRYLSDITSTHKRNIKIDKNVSSSVCQPTCIIRNLSFNSLLVNSHDQSYQFQLPLQEHTTNTSKNLPILPLTKSPSDVIIHGQNELLHHQSSQCNPLKTDPSFFQLFPEATLRPIKKKHTSLLPIAPDGFVPNSVVRARIGYNTVDQLLKNVMNSVTLTKGKAAGPLQIDHSVSKMNKEENFSKTQNLNNDNLQPANFNEERELVSKNKLSTINQQIIIGNKKDYQRTLEPHKSKKPLPPISTSNTGHTSKTSFTKIDSSLNEKSTNIKSDPFLPSSQEPFSSQFLSKSLSHHRTSITEHNLSFTMQNPRPSSPLSKATPTSLLSSSHSLDKHTLSPMKPNLIEIPSSMIPYKDKSPVIGDNTPQSMDELTAMLNKIITSRWFPSSTIPVHLVNSEEMLQWVIQTLLNLLETTTPPIFGEISRVIATLNDNTYLTENDRCTALDIILKRHREASSNMLKVDILKLIGQIGYSTDPIMMIILPSLISANIMVQNAAFLALKQLTGITNRAGLYKLLVDTGLLRYTEINEDQVLKDLAQRLHNKHSIKCELSHKCQNVKSNDPIETNDSKNQSQIPPNHMTITTSHMSADSSHTSDFTTSEVPLEVINSSSCKKKCLSAIRRGIYPRLPTPSSLPFVSPQQSIQSFPYCSSSKRTSLYQITKELPPQTIPFYSQSTMAWTAVLNAYETKRGYTMRRRQGMTDWNKFVWSDIKPLIRTTRNCPQFATPTKYYPQV